MPSYLRSLVNYKKNSIVKDGQLILFIIFNNYLLYLLYLHCVVFLKLLFLFLQHFLRVRWIEHGTLCFFFFFHWQSGLCLWSWNLVERPWVNQNYKNVSLHTRTLFLYRTPFYTIPRSRISSLFTIKFQK